MTEYICARWRAAATDPPHENWAGKAKYEGKQIRAYCNLDDCGKLHWFELEFGVRMFPDPGDQWLDITDMPAVPKEKVQALADLAKNRIRHGEIVQASEIYGLLVQEIEHFTGITPSGVKDSLTTEVPS